MSLVLALTLLGVRVSASAEPARVHVPGGVLVGAADHGIEVFKGVPYATPPVGPLRWKLPQPATAWTGEREATDFGPSCMQRTPPHNVPPGTRAAQLSEDCLTLNIWAPQNTKHAPVMVWLHGGGNENGSSADQYYDGAAFARDGVVLVSLNYRLGVLGFQPHDGQANFGLWDQVAALRWVKESIASFGGDPANVTLFGESAGGEDTIALLTAAPARGLFQKAIIESGGGGWGPPPTLVEAQASASASDLRALPAQTLIDHDNNGDWGPVVDGHLLTEAPLSALAAGRAAKLPLIIGTNGAEGSTLGAAARTDGLFPKLTKDDLTQLATLYGASASDDAALARLVFRDGYFAGPARWIASRVAQSGTPAYLYRFEYVLSLLQGRRAGAYHGSEIPFVFEHWPTRLVDGNDLRVGRAVHDCWVSFARTGKPTCADAPDWAPFGAEAKWMVLDAHPSSRSLEGGVALDLLQCRLGGPDAHAVANCHPR